MLNSRKSLRHVLLAAACALAATSVHAGSAFKGATEWTQLLNNAELGKVAIDGAETARKTVEQYLLQTAQHRLQQLEILALDPKAAPGNRATVDAAEQNLRAYRSALESLEGSLSQQVGALERRFAEAKLAGKPWDQYTAEVERDISNGNQRAIARLRYEESLLRRVDEDYAFARKVQEGLHGTVGSHQSLQMLNAQMNRVVSQNARMLEVMSRVHVKDAADKQAIEAASRQERMSAEARAKASVDAVRARQQHFGEALK
jgi:hypothetical protein